MTNTLTISIDNNKYTVAANNEDKVVNAANMLNEAIDKCKSSLKSIDNFSQLDTITFAALNIAEKKISDEIHNANQLNLIVNEMTEITEFISNLLDK